MARRLFESDDIFIGVTVLLESAWVLESVYGLRPVTRSRRCVDCSRFRTCGSKMLAPVAAALDAVSKGLEFADALHPSCGRRSTPSL